MLDWKLIPGEIKMDNNYEEGCVWCGGESGVMKPVLGKLMHAECELEFLADYDSAFPEALEDAVLPS